MGDDETCSEGGRVEKSQAKMQKRIDTRVYQNGEKTASTTKLIRMLGQRVTT